MPQSGSAATLKKPPPLRPQLPVIAARNIRTRLVWAELLCWFTPRLAKSMQPLAAAMSAASSRIRSAVSPVIGAAHSGE